MSAKYTWWEAKRQANLDRQQSFAYVFDRLTVVTVAYLPGETPRIISFRPAKRSEREVYHDWLENGYDDG